MKYQVIKYYHRIENFLESLNDVPLLLIRLTLAYGFYTPAINKWQDINAIAEWFESMNYPLPKINAYLAAGTEMAGVILLTIGFASRIITIPLMIVMLVAIFTVHLQNGWEASNNGFEIPFYYLIMLTVIFIYGPGKISIQGIINRFQK